MFGWREALGLWVRYLDFHWLFEEAPLRASLWERAAIQARNVERGVRYLPVYMRRYASLVVLFFSLALTINSAEAAPVAVGACATLGVVAVVALIVTVVGFLFVLRSATPR